MSWSWYGFFIGLAFVVFWEIFESNLRSISQSRLRFSSTQGAIFVIICTLIGARLYHLWTDWQLYASTNLIGIINIHNGGIGIFGAIFGGFIGLFLWKKISKVPFSWLTLLDSAAIALPAGQAIGRWGNYVNQELFGQPTALPWGIFIDESHRPPGYEQFSKFHPLFLYESIILLSFALFLFWVSRRFREILPLGSGWYLGCYLFGYGTLRFCLEFLRIDSAPGWLGFSIAQWVSLASVGLGLLFFLKSYRLQWLYAPEVSDPTTFPSLSTSKRTRRRHHDLRSTRARSGHK